MTRTLRLAALATAVASLSILSLACKKKNVDGVLAVADDKTAICLYDGMAVRATPSRTGKFLASLNLGESVRSLGDEGKDENGKPYLKVALSDGKEGWALAPGLVTGAKVGAITDDAMLFQRPDPLTATAKKVPFMTIVAVTQEKGGYFQVLGEGHRALGWVLSAAVVLEEKEVATAILATKKLREKDGLTRAAKVEAIAQRVPNPGSPFIEKLREQAAQATAAVPPVVPPGGEGEEPKETK